MDCDALGILFLNRGHMETPTDYHVFVVGTVGSLLGTRK